MSAVLEAKVRAQSSAAGPLPLTLYVHIPWCVRKCPYCDFNSHELRGPLPVTAYLDALLADLAQSLPALPGRVFASVYFGGGTPSLFPPAAIQRLLDGLCRDGRLAPDAEVSLEANPGTVDEANFRGYRAAGVNRLSLGVQSFDDGCLRALGRIHDGDAARRAAGQAAALFDNFNLDLMHGLPAQTPRMAAADVAQAVALGAAHLSVYQFTLEPNTVFAKYPPALPPEAALGDIEARVQEALAVAGYHQYEVSAYARPGRQCRHNLHYWEFADYLGIGAGAHSKLTTANGIVRQARVRVPKTYLQRVAAGRPLAQNRRLQPRDLLAEFMMNALRLTDGFSLALLAHRTGVEPAALRPELERAAEQGLLRITAAARVVPTALGRRYLDRLVSEFLPG